MPPPPRFDQRVDHCHVEPTRLARQRRTVRWVGIILACSTLISGLVTSALVAVLIGEQRLEGPTGSTVLSLAAFLMPLYVGLSIVVWSYRASKFPRAKAVGAMMGVVGVVFIGAAVWSITKIAGQGDASIGGGLLMLVGIGLVAGSAVLVGRDRAPV